MFRKFLKHIFYWSNRTANFCLSFFGIAITFQVERIDSKNKLPDYLHHLKPIDLEFGRRVGVVNLAIPYLAREDSIFAGTRMILALGATLLKSNIKLRFVITDEIWDHNSEKIAKNNFLKYFPDCMAYDFEVISVAKDNARKLVISEYDLFVATAWWTTYAWDQIFYLKELKYKRLFYLIQDFEPGFYPWGSDYALALNSYYKDIFPIYSTESLKNYFETVIKIRPDQEESAVYHPEISKETFYPAKFEFYTSARVKKVFCYCRPNIPRNMYRLLVEVLKESIKNGYFQEDEWEFYSGGESHDLIPLGHSYELKSLGKMSYLEYGEFLRTCDIGISLMYSPHPSYPPFEMAQSGVVTVTNSFPGKDLSTISKNIISCDVTEASLNLGLKKATELRKDYEFRIANSVLPFPGSYEECFLQPRVQISKIINDISFQK